MASVHVPFFLDGRPVAMFRHALQRALEAQICALLKCLGVFRGRPMIDGSLTDFLYKRNSPLLTAEGAYVLDYSEDKQLQYSRFGFLSLRSYEEVQRMMELGRAFGARAASEGRLGSFAGLERS